MLNHRAFGYNNLHFNEKYGELHQKQGIMPNIIPMSDIISGKKQPIFTMLNIICMCVIVKN